MCIIVVIAVDCRLSLYINNIIIISIPNFFMINSLNRHQIINIIIIIINQTKDTGATAAFNSHSKRKKKTQFTQH